MRHSESIANLAAALAKAQGAIEPVAKSKVNPHFRSSYAPLEEIAEAVREPLRDNGLAVIQTFGQVEGGVVVITTLLHESGEWYSGELVLPVEKGTAQGVGSAITYGRRYGLAAFLKVVSDEDDDGNAASAGNGGAKPAPPPRASDKVKSDIGSML